MRWANRDGVEHEFALDWDVAVQMDTEGDSIMKLVDMMAEMKTPLYAIDRLSKLIGYRYPDLAKMGYVAEDLSNILMGCLEELGFSSAGPAQPTLTSTPQDGQGD